MSNSTSLALSREKRSEVSRASGRANERRAFGNTKSTDCRRRLSALPPPHPDRSCLLTFSLVFHVVEVDWPQAPARSNARRLSRCVNIVSCSAADVETLEESKHGGTSRTFGIYHVRARVCVCIRVSPRC